MCVFIDSDALVLRRLDEAIEHAKDGRICILRDPDEDRFFAEWAEIFDLRAPLPRQPYFCTAFVAFSTEAWPELLRRWWETLERIWHLPSFMEGAPMRADPAAQGDQDAFNALLMSEVAPGSVHELPADSNVFPSQLKHVSIEDLRNRKCVLDGQPVSVLQCGIREPHVGFELRGLFGRPIVGRVDRQPHCTL